MSKNKKTVVWFVKTDNIQQNWAVTAKIKQLSDWLEKEKPFGTGYNVIIVPSNENKISFLNTEEEFVEDFKGEDVDQWLTSIKNKLEECLTINLLT